MPSRAQRPTLLRLRRRARVRLAARLTREVAVRALQCAG